MSDTFLSILVRCRGSVYLANCFFFIRIDVVCLLDILSWSRHRLRADSIHLHKNSLDPVTIELRSRYETKAQSQRK